ncbi:MAG: alpha/beta fold hydrolase [Erysipelotrichaceae bacterium]|nr:alpha/beta fold hydrolase [Erysipelotrichaceae bacterium]
MKQKVMMKSLDAAYDIVSVVTIPDTDTKSENYPVVVLCHGTGSNKDEVGNLYVELASKLAETGIASVRFDFVGNGESKEDYIGYTLTSAVNDVKSAVEYIKQNPLLDETRMGIVGFSQGGSVAALSVGAIEEFKCMVGWSAALSLESLATDEMRKTADAQGWAWLDFDFRDSVRLSKQWMDETAEMDLLPILKERHLPMLGIAGTLDTVVPCECSKKMVEATNHPDSELYLVETDHIFSVFEHDKAWPKVIDKTVSWLKEQL